MYTYSPLTTLDAETQRLISAFCMNQKDVVYPEGSDVQWDRWRKEVGYALRRHADTQQEKDVCKDFMEGKRLSPNGLRVLYRLDARASTSLLNTWREAP